MSRKQTNASRTPRQAGSKYRLTYFPLKGRAELIRLIFHAVRVPFIDRRITSVDWKQLKPETPTGTLPMLEVDGQKFGESGAIIRWAARKFGLYGKTDVDELRVEAILCQALELREMHLMPIMMERDEDKKAALTNALRATVDKIFGAWDKAVMQTEAMERTYSYMLGQSLTVADLALLDTADMVHQHLDLDFAQFPHLAAVIGTVSTIPSLRSYLNSQDVQGK